MTVVFVLLYFIVTGFCFNEEEITLVTELARSLAIKKCILVATHKEESYRISSTIKILSKKNILAISLDILKLGKVIKEINFGSSKSVVILKPRNNSELAYFLKELKSQPFYSEILPKFIWMLFLTERNVQIAFEDFNVPFNCQFLTVQKSDANYNIMEIYKRKNVSTVTNSNVGYYNNYGLKIDERDIYRRRNDFQGERMILEIDGEEEICSYIARCIHYDFWHEIARVFNFSIQVVTQKAIESNTSLLPDLSLDPHIFFATEKNLENLFGPVLASKTQIYVKHIGKDVSAWNIYLQPFSEKLWTMTLCWTLICSTAVILLSWAESRQLQFRRYTLLDEGLTPITALCNQNCNRPIWTSLRIAKISIFIVSGVIVPAFSASVISYLTTEREKLPFTDLNTLTEKGTYKLTSIRLPAILSYFEESHDPVLNIIRKKHLIDYNQFPKNLPDSIDMICSVPKLAIICFNYKLIQIWAPCKITMIPKEFIRLPTALELKNDGKQYRKLFFDILIKFRSAGVIDREERIMYGNTNFQTKNEIKPIELDAIKSLLAILVIAIICSIIFLLIETSYAKHQSIKAGFKTFT